MRRSMMILMVAILVTLSGCTEDKFPKSDDEIQADCLKIQPIQSNLVELVSFAIDSRSFNGDYFIVKAKIDLFTDKEEVKADVVMKYKKYNNTWYVESSEIIIKNVLTANLPNESLVKSVLVAENLMQIPYDSGMVPNLLNTTLDQNPGDGTITHHFSQDGGNLLWTWKNEGTVLLTYGLNRRWVPSILEQIYTETMNWNGIYKMTFYTAPGMDPIAPITITITGSMTLDVNAQGSETATSTVVGQFTINGIDYVVDGVIDNVTESDYKPNARRIRFVYENTGEALTILVSFVQDPIETYYEGGAYGLSAVVTRLD